VKNGVIHDLSVLQASTAIALAACCGGVYSPPLIIISLIF
jgi:hypothetical protein